jgi:hypothetical protein
MADDKRHKVIVRFGKSVVASGEVSDFDGLLDMLTRTAESLSVPLSALQVSNLTDGETADETDG